MGFKTNNINKYKEKIAPLLDKYSFFKWAGYDMWEKFNAFIINEKSGSLKFYNGPSFSNNYTKPQFETASSRLTGVTFNTQQISFTIAVYAVTEEKYRELIYVLHPYEINMLGFSFEQDYGYMVKLSKIQDSTRWVIGKDNDNQDLYYTELQLTFDVQGDAVARSFNQVSFMYDKNNPPYYCYVDPKEKKMSDLPTPLKLNFSYQLKDKNNSTTEGSTTNSTAENSTNNEHYVKFYVEMKLNNDDPNPITKELFYINLKNLVGNGTIYNFEYNSENGNLLLKVGNDLHLVSLLTTYNSGKRIVERINSDIFYMPGKWDLKIAKSELNWSNFKFYIEYDIETSIVEWESSDVNDTFGITMYRRTNLI